MIPENLSIALALLIGLGIAYFGGRRLWGMWLGDES